MGKIVNNDNQKYVIHPYGRLDMFAVRYDQIFDRYGFDDPGSVLILSLPLLSYKDVTLAFSKSDAMDICDHFGLDFDRVAKVSK